MSATAQATATREGWALWHTTWDEQYSSTFPSREQAEEMLREWRELQSCGITSMAVVEELELRQVEPLPPLPPVPGWADSVEPQWCEFHTRELVAHASKAFPLRTGGFVKVERAYVHRGSAWVVKDEAPAGTAPTIWVGGDAYEDDLTATRALALAAALVEAAELALSITAAER